ncbi:MAG: hypothetical protein KAT70_10040, partial [Thermoplasmata archaeon]|nr:hypothetical protein [Thermoplasmata archaeon]
MMEDRNTCSYAKLLAVCVAFLFLIPAGTAFGENDNAGMTIPSTPQDMTVADDKMDREEVLEGREVAAKSPLPLGASNDILVIDGKAGSNPYTSHDIICDALDLAGYYGLYDEWIVSGNGSPSLSGYRVVIYQDGYGNLLERNWQSQAFEDPERVNDFMEYLDAGGTMYLCGQNMASGLNGATGPEFATFLDDYLNLSFVAFDAGSAAAIGITGDPITAGLNEPLAENGGLPLGTDEIAAGASGHEIFRDGSNKYIGTRYDSGIFKTVFTSFNFCQYADNDADRGVLADNIVTWLTSLLTHDARTNTLDTHHNDTNYYTGLQNIKATVENHGTTAESFTTRCIITEFQSSAEEIMLDTDFEGNNFAAAAPDWSIVGGTTSWIWTKTTGYCRVDGDTDYVYEYLYSPHLNFFGKAGVTNLEFWHDFQWWTSCPGWVEISTDGGDAGGTWPSLSSDPRVVEA